jgi:NTE family protein
MDAHTTTLVRNPQAPWRPKGCDHIGLVLQGGGALGAYQAGVYEALQEGGLEPNWVAGVSIGAINAAIIVGNPPERRMERLRRFWDRITDRRVWPLPIDGDIARKARNASSAMLTMLLGQSGFFQAHVPGPWFSLRGAKQATSFYDNAPLRETLLELVDFNLINSGSLRFAVGAVNVANGNFYYFDNQRSEITPEHVMASGALPPGLPMVQLGTDFYWDGGLVSNTPLQHLLTNVKSENILIFQVDLFSAIGPIPRDMLEVLSREKDIRYSSRTRLVTDVYMQLHKQKVQMRRLLDLIPESSLSADDLALKRELADLPQISLMHLIYQQAAYEGTVKDYEFSSTTMREHWSSGYRDTRRTLLHRDWLELPAPDVGMVMHDVHRPEED